MSPDLDQVLDEIERNREHITRLLDEQTRESGEVLSVIRKQNRAIGTVTTILEGVEDRMDRYWTLITRVIIALFGLLGSVLTAVGVARGFP